MMHTVTMKKPLSMTIAVPMPKGRGGKVPPCRRFKDKRRQPKVAERANFRREFATS